MNFFLAKCEPSVYSIDDLKEDKSTLWEGVRNYQARNFLASMEKGDQVFFYHSNSDPVGIFGVMEVQEGGVVDPTQFDKKSDYYDQKATPEKARWISPRMKFKEKFKEPIPLEQLKRIKALAPSQLLKKGNRLSVIPLTKLQFESIIKVKEESEQ